MDSPDPATSRTRLPRAAANPMTSRAVSFAAGFGGGLLAGQALTRERRQFARLAGWSIVTPPAAGWVTDFLNAAYYRRPASDRQVDT